MKYCETNIREAKALVKTALFHGIMAPFTKAMNYQNPDWFYACAIQAKNTSTCWKVMQPER